MVGLNQMRLTRTEISEVPGIVILLTSFHLILMSIHKSPKRNPSESCAKTSTGQKRSLMIPGVSVASFQLIPVRTKQSQKVNLGNTDPILSNVSKSHKTKKRSPSETQQV
jgi:hypothetical protein